MPHLPGPAKGRKPRAAKAGGQKRKAAKAAAEEEEEEGSVEEVSSECWVKEIWGGGWDGWLMLGLNAVLLGLVVVKCDVVGCTVNRAMFQWHAAKAVLVVVSCEG